MLRNVISVYTSHFFNSRSNSKTSFLHNSIASLQISTSSPSIDGDDVEICNDAIELCRKEVLELERELKKCEV